MRLSQETITHRRGVIAGGNRPSMNGPVPVLRGSSCQNALVLISESRSARPRSENTSHTHAQLWPSFHSRARSSHTHLLLIFASWELGTPSASLQRLASCVPVSFKRLLIQGLLIYIYIYITRYGTGPGMQWHYAFITPIWRKRGHRHGLYKWNDCLQVEHSWALPPDP